MEGEIIVAISVVLRCGGVVFFVLWMVVVGVGVAPGVPEVRLLLLLLLLSDFGILLKFGLLVILEGVEEEIFTASFGWEVRDKGGSSLSKFQPSWEEFTMVISVFSVWMCRGIQSLNNGSSTKLRRITRDQCWIKSKTTASFNLTELEKVDKTYNKIK